MGIKRIVDTAFWTDGKVDEFSPEDKYFMLYLLTNPFSTQLGIYEISIKQVAFQMGYSMDAVKVLIERFENKYHMILFSHETNEIAILNFLRHSVVKGGKPVEDCILKEMKAVKNKKLLDAVFSNLRGRENLNVTVEKIVDSYFNDNENDNEKDNENENERTGDESSTNRPILAAEGYEAIKQELLSEKEDGGKICEWCGCKTTVLHKHHYPIPKRDGGKETVNICSNCHMEFHAKEAKKSGGKVDYQAIIDLFNSICVSFPSVRSLSDARRKAIKARLNTYTIDEFKAMFEIAEASSFLKGQNNRNWQANFDWLIKDGNFAKVLDGNYSDKKTGATYGANGIQIDQSKTDLDDLF